MTGYGIIDVAGQNLGFVACGTIRTTAEKDFFRRLYMIGSGLEAVIDQHRPERAAIEDVFMANNPNSALKLGQARGAAVMTMMRSGLDVAAYTPRRIKQAVVGYGQASKTQVQYMMQHLLELDALPSSDAADALAVALCHIYHLQNRSVASAS